VLIIRNIDLHRSKRQLAKIRDVQKPALTPDLYAPTPTPTSQSIPESILPAGTCSLCRDRITAGYLELTVNARCDISALKRKVEQLQHDLSDAKRTIDSLRRDRDEEHEEHGAIYRRMQSELELWKDKALNQFHIQKHPFSEMAADRKRELLDAVKRGEFIPHATEPTKPTIPAPTNFQGEEPCQKN
jgi:FtsZ-binding cell division protein ZapB